MKRNTKKLALLLLTGALAVSAFACGSKESSEEQADTSISVVVEGDVNQIYGTLISYADGEIEINSDGKDYVFDASTATITAENMVKGDDIFISYTGEITDADGTANVTVVSIQDLGKNATDAITYDIAGIVMGGSENSITIKAADGTILQFDTSNCELDLEKGVEEGIWVDVSYNGELIGTDTRNIKVIKVTDDSNNNNIKHAVVSEKSNVTITDKKETVYATAQVHVRKSYTTSSSIIDYLSEGEPVTRTGVCSNGWSRVKYEGETGYVYSDYLSTKKPKSETKTVKGEVWEISKDKIKIETKKGNDYTLDISKAEHHYKDGLSLNDTVVIEYTGSLGKKNCKVVSVTDKTSKKDRKENKKAKKNDNDTSGQKKSISGTVVALKGSAIVFKTNQNKQYSVDVSHAKQSYKNGIQPGNAIEVIFTGTLGGANMEILEVKDNDANAAQTSIYKGYVISYTNNTLTIKTRDAIQMTFSISEKTSVASGALGKSNYISITADASTANDASKIMKAKTIALIEKAQASDTPDSDDQKADDQKADTPDKTDDQKTDNQKADTPDKTDDQKTDDQKADTPDQSDDKKPADQTTDDKTADEPEQNVEESPTAKTDDTVVKEDESASVPDEKNEIVDEKAEEKEAEEEKPDETPATYSGTVIEASSSTLTIQTSSGKQSFDISNAKNNVGDLAADTSVKVTGVPGLATNGVIPATSID